MWSKQFLARAHKKGYKAILEGKVQVPHDNEVIPDDNDANKKKLLARQMNEEAYSDLLLSMKTEAAFNLVDAATTPELPHGSAKVAWDNLNKRYLPKDTEHNYETTATTTASHSNYLLKSDIEDWRTF